MDQMVLEEFIKVEDNHKISEGQKDLDISSIFCKTKTADVDGLPAATQEEHICK